MTDRLLEVSRPVSQSDTRVGKAKNARGTDVVSYDTLEVAPSDMIRTWSRDLE